MHPYDGHQDDRQGALARGPILIDIARALEPLIAHQSLSSTACRHCLRTKCVCAGGSTQSSSRSPRDYNATVLRDLGRIAEQLAALRHIVVDEVRIRRQNIQALHKHIDRVMDAKKRPVDQASVSDRSAPRTTKPQEKDEKEDARLTEERELQEDGEW